MHLWHWIASCSTAPFAGRRFQKDGEILQLILTVHMMMSILRTRTQPPVTLQSFVNPGKPFHATRTQTAILTEMDTGCPSLHQFYGALEAACHSRCWDHFDYRR